MSTNWDLLEKSLNGLRKQCPEGFTTIEFAEAMGWGPQTSRIKIGELIRAGMAKFVGDRPTKRMDGRNTTSPTYAFVKKK